MPDLFDDTSLDAEFPQDVVQTYIEPFIQFPARLYATHSKTLGPLGIAVYLGISSHANRKRGMTTFVLVQTLADELGMGESTVRREINRLESLNVLSKQRRFGRSTVYTVLPMRYDVAEVPLYGSESSATIERYNQKKYNQKKLTTENHSEPKGSGEFENAIQEVFNYYLLHADRSSNQYLLTDLRKKKALSRLKELMKNKNQGIHGAVDDMKLAIDGLVASPFHMGKNDRNTKYIDFIDNLFKSWEEMEKRINFAVGNTHGR